ALVVLDAKPLAPTEFGPDVVFSAVDVGFYDEQVAQDGIVAPVQSGLVMSQRHVMDLALMASANNYAQSLAAWAFGSEAGYVEAARRWLAEQGMTSTTIADATGINPGNVSTVTDLITLAKLAVADPVVSQIVATAALEIPQIGVVENRNALLGLDGIDGIKTGTLDEAGSCLLFSADHTIGGETVTLVGVVLGGASHDTINVAVRGILAQADAGFREVTLVTEGEPFADYETSWGDTATAVAASTATVVVWGATAVTAQITAEPVTLATAGTPTGRVTFSVGEREISVELVLNSTIDDPGPWWRLGNPARLL
ncbi:MAG: D-alanyl-D-alanine carboxypeptidase, partial [Rhodoglobus sp.]